MQISDLKKRVKNLKNQFESCRHICEWERAEMITCRNTYVALMDGRRVKQISGGPQHENPPENWMNSFSRYFAFCAARHGTNALFDRQFLFAAASRQWRTVGRGVTCVARFRIWHFLSNFPDKNWWRNHGVPLLAHCFSFLKISPAVNKGSVRS